MTVRARTQCLMLLVCFLVGMGSVCASEPTIVLLPDGTAWFSPGPNQPTILIKNIIRAPGMPPGGNTPPGGEDPQPPTEDTDRTEARKLAEGVDDAIGATMLAKTYELLGEYIASGKIPSDATSVDKAVTEAVDKTLEMLPGRKADEWEAVHLKLVDRISRKLIANGGKLGADQWSTFFRSCSEGLNDTVEGNAIPPFLEPLIAALVKMLIELLTEMFE